MAGHDELVERPFGKKVDRLKALMEASLRPAYRGYYGQLVPTDQQVGEMAQARRAAGRTLGWKTVTHIAAEGRLVIVDDRDPPGCSGADSASRR
ncbi:hypothetical protein [Spongiactinospora gelatinilytica]|uniref:hypothetical protein n=1 Tax=Spongiactinospora gelatinilytica TaxID=2666298 RepID=UPI0011B944C1|nr:hypothetical protein [Spongiactinospora gelatinilytica]